LELFFCFQFRFWFRFHHPDVPFCFFELILKYNFVCQRLINHCI
jgi:hypothetical protein